ncbi:YheC/YheD family endospore coat-associated protein [Neobacillus kokaensis]|nr:YheC/YheD family protein [Neobacillus kokaensis]
MDTIGVLLSTREWNQLRRKNNIQDEIWCLFVEKAQEFNLKIVFFTLQHISLKTLETEAIEIEKNLSIKKSTLTIPSIIYNPTKFFHKKNIKFLRELSSHPNFLVINEHQIIKKKNLHELIQAHPDLNLYFEDETVQSNVALNVYILGQKSINNVWSIPIIYINDIDENKYLLAGSYPLLVNQELEYKEVKEFLMEQSQKLLKIIHYYYPGIYEIGIQFSIHHNGQIFIRSTCSFNYIIKELFAWKRQLCYPIFESALNTAKELLDKDDSQEKPLIESQPKFSSGRKEFFSGTDKKQLKEDGESFLWVKLKPFDDEDQTVKLPVELINSAVAQLNVLQFGIKQLICKIVIEEDIQISSNSFQTPIEISISSSLLKMLRIPENIVYQLKVSANKIIIGPTIGLLLGEKNQLYNPSYMEKFTDRLGVYEKFGGLVIAFSTRSIDWEEKIAYGLIYDPVEKKWDYGSAPIPASLYRRNFHQKPERIKQLIELTDHKLFNSHHYKKSDLLQLQAEKKIKKHLPDTHLYKNMSELIKFVNAHQKVILKPVSLSRGRGIFVIEQDLEQGNYVLYDYRKGFRLQHLIPDVTGLAEMLRSLNVLNEKYLYQTYIPLLKVDNCPFDVRVVMQKQNKEHWICSGIECRVAGENEVLTNIARGGKAMTLEEVIEKAGDHLSFEEVEKNILKLCQQFCHLMEEKDEHFGEFGLDIGLDQEGYPWLIEANIFPSFKGFKAMDYDIYLKIRYQPIIYAVRLQGFKVAEMEEEMTNEVYHSIDSNS